MPLTPVNRRSVPDAVFDQLLDDILAGELAPGAELPAERRLAEVLGVSRPAVREALQRLAHGGLIDVRQGDATTVRDYRRSAGPELLPRLLLREGGPDLDLVRDVLEARLALVPDVARRCAQRRSDRDVEVLREHVEAMRGTDEVAHLQELAHGFSTAMVDGTRNVVYRLLFNALEAAYVPVMGALTAVMEAEVSEVSAYAALTEAIAAQDAARAGSLARKLIALGTRDGMAAIAALTGDDAGPLV